MRSLPRLLLAAFAVAVCERPSAYGQDRDPRTGLPNQNSVSVIANGAAAPNALTAPYGPTVLPGGPPPGPEGAIGDALGPGTGAQLTRFMPRVGVTYIAGDGLGWKNGFGAFDAWVPLQVGDENELMFSDMRGIVDNDARVGANLGLGYRFYNKDRDRVCGVYGYYDYRDSGVARYNQISVGFESLGRSYDYRVNVYVPIADHLSVVSDTFDCDNPQIIGSNIYLTHRLERESAMKGIDGEFGFPISTFLRTKAFFGAYAYDGHQVPHAIGVRARLESQATENLFLQLTAQTDNAFKGNVWGGFTWTFPGPSKRYGDEEIINRLNDSVSRNYSVVAQRHTRVTQEAALSPTSGLPISILFVDDDAPAGGTGTTGAPFNTLAQAQAAGVAGDIIFVRAGTYVGQSITLKNDQRLLGDGVPALGGICQNGGYLVTAAQCPNGFQLPASRNLADRPTILNAPGDAITLASRNEVGSFNIVGSGNSGIAGNGGQSFNIHDVTVAQSGGSGIRLTDMAGTGSLHLVTSTQNGGNGVLITNSTGTVTVDVRCYTGTLNALNGMALNTDGGSITANIFNSDFNNNAGNGLSATAAGGGSVTMNINSSRFDANTANGAFFDAADGAVTADIRNSNFDANTGTGVSAGLLFLAGNGAVFPITSGQADITIARSSFSNNEGNGIQGRVDGPATTMNFTMSGSTVNANGFAGVTLNAQDGVSTLALAGNRITNNSRNGFSYLGFGASSTTATFTNNVIAFNGADPFAPAALRDGVLLQAFTTSANALDATFTNNQIVNNGGAAGLSNRGNGVFITAFDTGAAATAVRVSFNGDNISGNQESGIRGLFGGGGSTVAATTVTLAVAGGATIDGNGLDGVTIDNNQFGALTATFDNSFVRNNAQNGVLINNIALAAGEQPSLATRFQRNVIDDNGFGVFADTGAFVAGINIVSGGRGTGANRININDNLSISRNGIGIFVRSGVLTETSITNHRNALNDAPRIADNEVAGIVLTSALTGGPVPQNRAEVHDVRISNNVIKSDSEAIVLIAIGGSANPALGGGRMDAIVTQNTLFGTGFTPIIGTSFFGPPPLLTVNRGIENARFLAISGGVRSFMRVRLEQNNVNDLQYNMIVDDPSPTAPGNTDGNLFDIASSAGTNQGFNNPILAPPFFGANTGVYGFAHRGVPGIFDSLIDIFPSTIYGADFDPAQTNLAINVVIPTAIAPGPFPPPP